MPESVKVLTVYRCDEHHWKSVENNWCPECNGPTGRSVPYVPQAELDRLRAVGESLTRQVGKLLDSWYEFDDDRVSLEVFIAAVNERIEDVDAALKSYCEAVPE